jgi:DNA-binding transcriptional LysR family regulator
MGLDVGLVLHFGAVAEDLSFTRAAARLGVAQPWLSTRIRQLETQLGVPLFARSTRRVELTEEGHALFARAKPLMEAARAVEELAGTLRGGAGRLRVGMPPYGSRIPERIALVGEFARRWPSTSVELDVGWTPVLLDRVRQGLLDLAFVIGGALPPEFEARTICETRPQLLLDPGDALTGLEEVPTAALRGRRVAVFTRGLNPELFDRLFAPVAAAGGTLVQMPDLLDFRREGQVRDAELVIVQCGWGAPTAARHARRILRPMALPEGAIPLQLVRRRDVTRLAASRFWELAQRETGRRP